MVGEGAFAGFLYFCYLYLIVSCGFLTYSIFKNGFLSQKDEEK